MKMSKQAQQIRAKAIEEMPEDLINYMYNNQDALHLLNAACQWAAEQK